MTLEIVKMSAESLLAKKTRTFLSMLGIIIGVATVIAVFAVGKGAQESVNSQFQNTWTCSNCNTEHQRDENAVVNIFVEGLRILAEGRSVSACGATVRPKRELRRAAVKQETSLETSSHAA